MAEPQDRWRIHPNVTFLFQQNVFRKGQFVYVVLSIKRVKLPPNHQNSASLKIPYDTNEY